MVEDDVDKVTAVSCCSIQVPQKGNESVIRFGKQVDPGGSHVPTSFSLHVTTMNPNSPGRASLEDDIEWIAMEDVAEPSNSPLNPPSTHAPDLPPQVSDDDEDEFDIDRDEGSRGLLSSTHGPTYNARYLEPVGIAPGKNIVIEVRVIVA